MTGGPRTVSMTLLVVLCVLPVLLISGNVRMAGVSLYQADVMGRFTAQMPQMNSIVSTGSAWRDGSNAGMANVCIGILFVMGIFQNTARLKHAKMEMMNLWIVFSGIVQQALSNVQISGNVLLRLAFVMRFHIAMMGVMRLTARTGGTLI